MIISKILDVLYSIYVNFRLLPFRQALKMPLLVSHKVCVDVARGSIIIQSKCIHRGMIILGKRGFSAVLSYDKSSLVVNRGARFVFYGAAVFSEGFSVWIDSGGVVEIGDRFYINTNSFIRCKTSISFGEHFLGGWNVSINDCDGHSIVFQGVEGNGSGRIIFEKDVWVCSYCIVGKNVCIKEGSVVGQSSLVVAKSFPAHTLIAGHPAKVLKESIEWIE